MDAPFPMHPSYESRAGVPDRAFPWVSPAQGERMTAAWARLIAGSEAMRARRLLHLHHLTPIHDAADAVLPGVPVVTHLHGTELRMLDSISRQEPPLAEGPHARWWERRLRAAAQRAVATITISPYEQARAVHLLGLDPDTVHCLPNGVDVDRFTPYRPSDDVRRALWLRWLVHDAQGWDEKSAAPGSVHYDEREVLDAFFDPVTGEPRPVLMFVGRFLGFKRVPLLIRAYARARARMATPVPLVIWGGMPGEWEGEHPHTVATREGVDGVFFTGWRGHDDLPLGLSCADCFVAPSTDEPFGLVYLEAMACELPVIGTRERRTAELRQRHHGRARRLARAARRRGGADRRDGDCDRGRGRTRRRAANAGRHARERHSWRFTAGRLAEIYDEFQGTRRARTSRPGRARRPGRTAVGSALDLQRACDHARLKALRILRADRRV